jgi:hypothetical protein
MLAGPLWFVIAILGCSLVGAGLYLLVCRPLFRHGSSTGMRALRCALLQLLFSPGFVGGHGIAVLPFGYLFVVSLDGRDHGIITWINVPIYLLAVVLSFVLETKLARAARAADERREDEIAAARAKARGGESTELDRALSAHSPRFLLAIGLAIPGSFVTSYLVMGVVQIIPAIREMIAGTKSVGPAVYWLMLALRLLPVLLALVAAYLFLRLYAPARRLLPGKAARLCLTLACTLGGLYYLALLDIPFLSDLLLRSWIVWPFYGAVLLSIFGWILVLRDRRPRIA